ncbi:hypothetical protein EXT48_11500 [Pseudoalteromonas sp. CO348]|uniref:DUF6419 family natural product biosynthesis protein n=1 Tax=Pseudoalteromonas TaxID=53246 RepID=UPI001022C7A4|nr:MULTISPECIES: DUF6419 family natural product biosynthesis protein [Pseudoalteromonas]MCG7538513.1 DUF6419 family natural product biosynthesis protein [Pseudoalteromonas sp. OF7H-1]QZO13990.1 hypothetical protein K5642_05605 [Pseudoalteromonas piscicida]RZG04967.1 hypothetical protein EXT48_11500 [Pseudoalteromonas sp. CO348]WMO14197.1 DUF6419 family natural product biosynthesis protein [Pseudoalteromonas piscicida]
MQQSIFYLVTILAFAAMLSAFHLFPEAVIFNVFSSLFAALLGYRAYTRWALLLCCINVLAMTFCPLLDSGGWLSLKGAVVFVCCVMFFAIALGCNKAVTQNKRFYY